MTATRFTALVLAGRRGGEDPVASQCGVEDKCLARAGGVPMLARVLHALAASPDVDRIFVVMEDPAILGRLPDIPPCTALPSAPTPSLSVLRALDEVEAGLPMLVTTADHALLSPAIVAYFLAGARATGAEVAVGLTAAEVISKAYPSSQRTYLRFRDAHYSGANLFALMSPEASKAVVFWRRVEQERKRPWRMIRAFGLGSLLAYLLGLLSLDDAMARASAIIGARIAAVRLPFAEAAIDVDKPADLELVNAILARRS